MTVFKFRRNCDCTHPIMPLPQIFLLAGSASEGILDFRELPRNANSEWR